MTLALRGHHFLCTLHYQGAGYSDAFTRQMTAVTTAMAADPAQPVTVAEHADPICAACPSLQADGRTCATEPSIRRRDDALLAGMGWRHGQTMPLAEAQAAVLARREALMETVCAGCEWLPRCTEKGPHGIASPLRKREPGA